MKRAAVAAKRAGGIFLAVVILNFDRLVDVAVGAGDGDVRAAVAARTAAFFALDLSGRMNGFSSVVAVDHSHMNALCGRTGKQNLQALERRRESRESRGE